MAEKRQVRRGTATRVRPWWRPLAYSAATAAAIAALFNPLPASAAPGAPVAPPAAPGAVPDVGSRPIAVGSITLPGQRGTTPTTTPPTTTTPVVAGLPTSPLMRKVEAGRAEIAAKGEELAKLDEEIQLVRTQLTTADQKVVDTQAAVTAAQQEVATAAAASVRDAAAQPPGTFGSGLRDLDALARIQRGESATEQAAGRQLTIVQAAHTAAVAEQQSLRTTLDRLTAEHAGKKAALDKKVAAQQKLERDHADEIAAADAASAAQDSQLGAGYLAGSNAGRGADPRAIAALKIALAQRGDPYVWSEEGPNQFDCSGLMYYAYRSDPAGNFPLRRVSRDQYLQTDDKRVDRYSLLAGDLLFFSSSTSWQGIHHVAMYAGDGMMVEAPRTGLNVRLVPVRWTRLFAATRIYGSVEGVVEGPDLGTPDAETPSDHSPTTPDGNPTTPGGNPTTPPNNPSTPPSNPSTPPSNPSTPPSNPSTPPSNPSTPPSNPSTPPSNPSTPPSNPSTPPSNPSTAPSKPSTAPTDEESDEPSNPPTTGAPTSTPDKPEGGSSSSPSGSAGTSDATKSPTATATTSKTTSAPATKSASASASKSAEAKQSGNS